MINDFLCCMARAPFRVRIELLDARNDPRIDPRNLPDNRGKTVRIPPTPDGEAKGSTTAA
jgi:hypothetical protein